MKRLFINLIFILHAGISLSQKINIAYPAPGSIHPNAKYIDADELLPFVKGTAVISKGKAEAIIDSTGSFVVNFNKYRILTTPFISSKGMSEGVYELIGANGIYRCSPATATKLKITQLINSAGKLIYTAPAGYEIMRDNAYSPVAMDAPFEGKLSAIPKSTKDPVRFSDDICVFSNGSIVTFKSFTDKKWGEGYLAYLDKDTKKWGYKNSKGVIVIKPQFEYAQVFSNGLAAVAMNDEFKQAKWGYINKKGQLLIPYKFSNQPGNFSEGLAWVVPKTSNEFKYAFIDTTGEIQIKITADSPVGRNFTISRQLNSKFKNGFFVTNMSEALLMDLHETVYTPSGIMGLFGLPDSFKLHLYPFVNNQMYISKENTNQREIGIINFSDRSVVPAIFYSLSMFDPASNLAYAKLLIGRDETTHTNKFIEGYINRKGVFVIVKKAGSTW